MESGIKLFLDGWALSDPLMARQKHGMISATGHIPLITASLNS